MGVEEGEREEGFKCLEFSPQRSVFGKGLFLRLNGGGEIDEMEEEEEV